MSEVKIKILKDHEAAPDGVTLQPYKKGEVISTGTARLSADLFQWHQRNSGFSEIIIEEKAISKVSENKAMKTAPENKAIQAAEENKKEEEAKIEEPAAEQVSDTEDSSEKADPKKFVNPLKKRK